MRLSLEPNIVTDERLFVYLQDDLQSSGRNDLHTINTWIELNARKHPAKEALVGIDGRVTFSQLAERAWGLARGLQEKGVRPATNIGVMGSNTVFNAEMFFSVAAAGGVYVAYNWRWSAVECAQGIAETAADFIIVEAQFDELVDRALAKLSETQETLPHVIRESEINALRTGNGPLASETTLDSPLCILYTGGSTGTPKGVVLSHRAAVANAFNEMIDCRVGTRQDERGLIVTPLFHTAGLLCWLATHFIAGATSVLAPKFDVESFVETVERERVTNTFLIPNMVRKMLDLRAFDSPILRENLKAVHTGAGLLRMPDKQLFAEMLPDVDLYFRYGLTEAGPMVTRLLAEDMLDPEVDGSIGQPYLMVDVELQDLDGNKVAVGELGEICVRSPSLMLEYYGRAEQTADALRDGWLRTGDLAVVDEHGYFFFRDRLKEMIKSGGENVYAAEVEQVLYLHPSVLEAAVVGVPDPEWDEEVRAAVVLRSDLEATEAELRTFMREHLAGYKVPKTMVFITADELPRSPAGKLVKSQLKDQLGWV